MRDIEISAQRLQEFPEDDVPEEINAIVQQTEEVAVLDEETDGYVPGQRYILTENSLAEGALPVITHDWVKIGTGYGYKILN